MCVRCYVGVYGRCCRSVCMCVRCYVGVYVCQVL